MITWPTMMETADWNYGLAMDAFRSRREPRGMGGDDPREHARYRLRVAKEARDKARRAGDRAYFDPW